MANNNDNMDNVTLGIMVVVGLIFFYFFYQHRAAKPTPPASNISTPAKSPVTQPVKPANTP